MGYLTTLTVYNDGIDLLPDHSEKFSKGVLDASREAGMYHRPMTIGVGMFCNLVKIQVPRHADDNTVYVHMGNTVFEMKPFDQQTVNMLKTNPDFFKKSVEFLDRTVKDLKKMMKNNGKNI